MHDFSGFSQPQDGFSQPTVGLSQPAFDIPVHLTDNKLYNFNRFKDHIPDIFHPYISRIQDVVPDGNCGFQSLAVALGLPETEWLTIRHALLTESIQNANVYINVLLGVFDEIQESLKWSKPEFAPRRYWMQMPETGLLIANAFGVIVVFISLGASVTIFPLWTSPEFLQPHRIVSFVFVNDNHFVMVELTGDYPMPTPSWYWSRFKSQDAAAWEMWYKQCLDSYTNWLESRRQPPGFVDLDKYGL
ncbi:hypothetical protein E3N88_45121 [Mikania micrantha]|uniref:OTU domain-containing protein n=1 Tax=Mikania micrantha TaxID=192012 RepID=A0A5N6LAP2_9ASTR|nr:hypothetical protein E3N88_45121 [Mikania micrantha]